MRHVRIGIRDGEVAYSLRRVFRQNVFVALVASAVALAVVSTLVQRAPSYAATMAKGVAWNPGPVNYTVGSTGCLTSQDATFQTDSEALATTIKNVLIENQVRIKTDFPADSPVRAVGIDDVEGTSSGVKVHLYGVLSDAACSPATSAGRSAAAGAPAASPAGQAAGLRAPRGGTTSPAANLDSGRGIQLAASAWTEVAWMSVAAVALFAAIAVVGTAGLVAAATLAGVVVTAFDVTVLAGVAGCAAGAGTVAALKALDHVDLSWQAKLGAAVGGCIGGAGLSAGFALGALNPLGVNFAAAIRGALAAPAAVVGEAAVRGAAQAGVELQPVGDVVQAAAAGAAALR